MIKNPIQFIGENVRERNRERKRQKKKLAERRRVPRSGGGRVVDGSACGADRGHQRQTRSAVGDATEPRRPATERTRFAAGRTRLRGRWGAGHLQVRTDARCRPSDEPRPSTKNLWQCETPRSPKRFTLADLSLRFFFCFFFR